jgi:hypothetical protein
MPQVLATPNNCAGTRQDGTQCNQVACCCLSGTFPCCRALSPVNAEGPPPVLYRHAFSHFKFVHPNVTRWRSNEFCLWWTGSGNCNLVAIYCPNTDMLAYQAVKSYYGQCNAGANFSRPMARPWPSIPEMCPIYRQSGSGS